MSIRGSRYRASIWQDNGHVKQVSLARETKAEAQGTAKIWDVLSEGVCLTV